MDGANKQTGSADLGVFAAQTPPPGMVKTLESLVLDMDMERSTFDFEGSFYGYDRLAHYLGSSDVLPFFWAPNEPGIPQGAIVLLYASGFPVPEFRFKPVGPLRIY